MFIVNLAAPPVAHQFAYTLNAAVTNLLSNLIFSRSHPSLAEGLTTVYQTVMDYAEGMHVVWSCQTY